MLLKLTPILETGTRQNINLGNIKKEFILWAQKSCKY